MKKKFSKVSTALALVVIMIVNMAVGVSAANIINVKVNGTIKYDEAFNCLDILNRERAAVGLSALTMDQHLMEVATTRAYEVCVLFSHDRPNGQSCTSLQNTNTYYGENIASGYNTASQVMEGWMNSYGHKANILNGNYCSVGIACVNGTWVQEFSGYTAYSASKPSNRTETRNVECDLNVMSIKPSFYYSGTQSVKEGETIQLHAPLLYMNGQQCYNIDDSTFTASSSNTSVATISGMTLKVLKGGDFSVKFILNGTNLSTTVNFHSESISKSISNCTVTLEKSEYVYTGSRIMPKITVKGPDGTLLRENTDFTVRYGENIETCWGTIYVTGIGNYSGALEHSFEISRAKLNECTISIPSYEYTYTGKQIKPTVTVKTPQGKVLKEGNDCDYILEYGINIHSGWGTVTVKGRGNYSGIVEKMFQISKKNLSQCSLNCTSYTYDGTPKTPKLTEGVEGKDYTITYSNNTNVGTATAKVEMLDFENYYGEATFSFTIKPNPNTPTDNSTETVKDKPIVYFNDDVASIKLEYDTVTITSRDQSFRPKVISVTLKDGTKIPNDQFTVSYSMHFVAGTAKVKINSDNENFYGHAETTFTILPMDLKDAKITLDAYEFQYTGNEIYPKITVEGFPLGSWKYSIKDNRKPGTATITIEGDCESLVGTRVITFKILENQWSKNAEQDEAENNQSAETTTPTNNNDTNNSSIPQTGTGNNSDNTTKTAQDTNHNAVVEEDNKISQSITTKSSTYTKTVGCGSFYLGAKASTDLTYSSSNMAVATVTKTGKVTIKGAGTATITIKAAETNQYNAATKMITITVKPKRPVISQITKSGKKITIRLSSKLTGISGVQIAYRIVGKDVYSYKALSTTALKTFKFALPSKGKYQICIRTYKLVGNEKIYSEWSTAKTVTVS